MIRNNHNNDNEVKNLHFINPVGLYKRLLV